MESALRDYELQDPTAVIYGTDRDAGEVIFSAHLFEGYTKQGANDNISGSVVILDVARTLNTLIEEGRIPRPKRNIRFLWIPEFSGTGPWVNAHKELMGNTLCNINLDMVGLHLSKSHSFFCLMRTTFGNPHYLNDVMEHYYSYVGETNREMIHNRRAGGFTKRIVPPSGSDDPFYYKIDPHYGSSDHEVFNDLEKRASSLVPRQTVKVKEAGYQGHSRIIRELPSEITDRYPVISLYDTRELSRLVNGKHSALDIKKLLDTQSTSESDLQSIMNYLEWLKYAGLIEM